jgi:hypothetical protein
VPPYRIDGGRAVRGRDDIKANGAKFDGKRLSNNGIVIDNQNFLFVHV